MNDKFRNQCLPLTVTSRSDRIQPKLGLPEPNIFEFNFPKFIKDFTVSFEIPIEKNPIVLNLGLGELDGDHKLMLVTEFNLGDRSFE